MNIHQTKMPGGEEKVFLALTAHEANALAKALELTRDFTDEQPVVALYEYLVENGFKGDYYRLAIIPNEDYDPEDPFQDNRYNQSIEDAV